MRYTVWYGPEDAENELTTDGIRAAVTPEGALTISRADQVDMPVAIFAPGRWSAVVEGEAHVLKRPEVPTVTFNDEADTPRRRAKKLRS